MNRAERPGDFELGAKRHRAGRDASASRPALLYSTAESVPLFTLP